MKKLFIRQELGFQTEFQNGAQAADTDEQLMFGTPGYLDASSRSSGIYFYRRYYDVQGKSREEYVGGPEGTPDGDAARDTMQSRIERAAMMVTFVKKMRRLGFQCVDDKAGATLVAIHNHALFSAGLTLIGSHAYGVILNTMGITARSVLTEDIDLARTHALHFAEGSRSMLTTLKSSGSPYVEISTGLDSRSKNSAFKLLGKEKLIVDLLVSGANIGKAVHIPERHAYAQEVPHLDYLAQEKMHAVVLSKNYVVPVFVPKPERFAIHKLFSSQSRNNQLSKSEKDLLQAATVIAAIEETYPGDIADEMLKFPVAGMKKMIKGAVAVMPLLTQHHLQIAEGFTEAIAKCNAFLDAQRAAGLPRRS